MLLKVPKDKEKSHEKNLIAFTLILCLVFSSLPICAAEKADIKKIDSQIMLKMTNTTKTNSGTSDAFYIGNVFICTEKINDNTCSIISYINSIIFALVIPMVCHTKKQLL